jgi:hypothetical protein
VQLHAYDRIGIKRCQLPPQVFGQGFLAGLPWLDHEGDHRAGRKRDKGDVNRVALLGA